MEKIIQCSSEDIREAIKSWIDEADNETIERIWNENFDEEITYITEDGLFEIPESEAERNGIS